ncbi:MAG: hypothetical protein GY869_13335, partial [Planctomycetes bacterium]|nr:hypothetical protein [Planctomycetota bacterium]
PVTCGRQQDRQPSFAPDGKKLIYSSDRGGLRNLYVLRSDGVTEQWTNYASGAFNPRFTADGQQVVFSGYQELGLRVFEIPLPDTAYALIESSNCAPALSWEPPRIDGSDTRGVAKYSQKFSFDIAQSAVSYDAVYGALGGFQTALTDVLGDKQYFFLLANNTDSKDDFISSFNVSATYLDRSRRINYG